MLISFSFCLFFPNLFTANIYTLYHNAEIKNTKRRTMKDPFYTFLSRQYLLGTFVPKREPQKHLSDPTVSLGRVSYVAGFVGKLSCFSTPYL